MAILSNIKNALSNWISWDKKPAQINKAINLWVLILSTDATLEKYYNIYQDNQFVRSSVLNLMDTVWKSWYTIFDSNWKEINISTKNQIDFLFEDRQRNASFKQLKKRIIRDYMVWGNVYIYKVTEIDEDWNPTDKVNWFQILDPRFVKPITDSYWVVYWYLQTINWQRRWFLPDEVWHLKYDSDLDDETLWLPLLRSLNVDIELDEQAKKSNLSFFKNNQTPTSLIILEQWVPEEDQKEIRKVLQNQFKGWENHHKWAVMKWIKEIIKIQDKIEDEQFLNMRKFTLENVCALFGVPKTILGYTEGVNYSNAQTQFVEYIEHTIKPIEETLQRFFTRILNDCWFEWITFEFIDDHIDQKQVKSKTVIELANNWIITINEAREELGLEISTQEWSDKLWIWTNKKIVMQTKNVDNWQN